MTSLSNLIARNIIIVKFDSKECNFFGKVMSKTSHGLYKVRFNSLPLDDNELDVYCEHISVLHPGEDEKLYDREEKNAKGIAAEYETANRKTKTDLVKQSVNDL